ncbi:tetratricopeptide repeat protein 1-like [Trifolium pratense]|uniref:Tetratricopeptide repeat protein 1-like n=1 Tax=Trifolium pratense TaxID=57577 RepID=A0A2K3NS59_TRIPR|nr:tetratricopeptide repeat protein 1-like [Trifolium pratense]
MVVIEHEKPDDQNSNQSNATAAVNDASDGFETASEADLDSDGEESEANGREEEQKHREQPQQKRKETEGEHGQDALINEEELKQKASGEANEAKVEGNKLFVDGKYEEALSQYEHALQVAPDMPSSVEIRSICHSNRAVCFLKLGNYENTIKECTKALELNPAYVKALVRRGEAHEKLEHFEEAIAAKLKEMGNSVLGRFGMSVDNFKAVKDPNTGSYSISMER